MHVTPPNPLNSINTSQTQVTGHTKAVSDEREFFGKEDGVCAKIY